MSHEERTYVAVVLVAWLMVRGVSGITYSGDGEEIDWLSGLDENLKEKPRSTPITKVRLYSFTP